MLKDTFFTIQSSADAENSRTYHIAVNDLHPIFQAHFAGNPIMPGACVVQLIKELVSDYFGRDCFVCTVRNMKFLHAINPSKSPELSVQLTFTQQEEEQVSVSAVLNNGDKVFVKSALMLKILEKRLRCATE